MKLEIWNALIPRLAWTLLVAVPVSCALNAPFRPLFAQSVTGRLPDAPQETGDRENVEGPLDLLSRNKYSRRQQATLEMWRQRDESREQVQEAARHPDPEVAGRAKWILRQWRRGSLPDTPPEVSRLLQRSEGPAAVEQLLEGGHFNAAVVAIEESAGTLDHEAIQKRISLALNRRFPVYVHEAIKGNVLQDLLKLVDLVGDTKEMAVCRIQLMQQLGIDLKGQDLLPKSASSWSLVQRERALTLVLLVLGKLDEAIEVTSQSSDVDLLNQCRMIASRWAEAAADSVVEARKTESGTYEHARLWCLTLIAADRARDDALRTEAITQLSSVENDDDDLAAELRWKCLASHGELDAAFAILDRVSPDASASVAIDASRTARAFEALGYPLDQIDLQLGEWIDEAIESQRTDMTEDLTPEIRRIFALMQCLLAVGRDDAAWTIAKRLSLCDVNVETLRLREFVLSTLTMTKRTDWVVKLAVADGEKILSPTSHNTISRTLPDTDAITFEIVMQGLVTIMPGRPLRARVEAAADLLRGELPRGFDREQGFRSLFDYVTGPRPINQFRGRPVLGQEILANLNIVQLFARHGEVQYASQCLRKLAARGDVKAMFYLAEQELDGGRIAEANALFKTVIDTVSRQGRSTTRRSASIDDVGLAVKALVGTWVAARRSGDIQLAESLRHEIKLVLCTPSTRLRSTIAEYLGERGESILALDAYEVLLPMSVFGNEEQTELYDVARSYSLLARKTNPADAARWFDLAVGGTLDSMSFRPGAYITLPLYVGRWSLEAAIKSNDNYEVERQLKRILKLDPMDIDFAERLLPEMRKVGMGKVADETLNRIIDDGLAYFERFPFDAMTCNNLAWVAAMNGKRLDDALRLSENAVYVEPDSAIYRDTLAEVLFQLGRKSEALQVERGCLLDDPGQWHLHQQIDKYEAALAEDPS
ncbi:MAG: tetratricopeptide repeat protein [Rubripirellula sp.]